MTDLAHDVSGQIHDLDPVRVLAHRVFLELGELPAVRIIASATMATAGNTANNP